MSDSLQSDVLTEIRNSCPLSAAAVEMSAENYIPSVVVRNTLHYLWIQGVQRNGLPQEEEEYAEEVDNSAYFTIIWNILKIFNLTREYILKINHVYLYSNVDSNKYKYHSEFQCISILYPNNMQM